MSLWWPPFPMSHWDLQENWIVTDSFKDTGKPDAIWEVLQTKQDFTMLKPRTGRVDVWSERPSRKLSLKSLFPRLSIHICEVMWPWRFQLYLDLERPIRMDDSTQSRQINGKGAYNKHNQLHSYILCGFFPS